MLSRVADAFYWTGRYLERAEHTARLVDVNTYLSLDSTPESSGRHWHRVFDSLQATMVDGGTSDVVALVHQLALDRGNKESVASSIHSARENLRQIREQISVDLWERINRLYWAVRRTAEDATWQDQPHQFLRGVIEDCHQFIGLTTATMNRGEGYYFLELGRFLERALTYSALLDTHVRAFPDLRQGEVAPEVVAEWTALLRSCTALEAYTRRFTARIDARRIADFLLLDPEFPRSIRFAVEQVEAALRGITRLSGRENAGRPERLAGRLRASLHYAQLDEIVDDSLQTFLNGISGQCGEIHAATYRTFIGYHLDAALVDLMQYTVRHLTRFTYDNPISESVMEVRMQPRTEQHQRCLGFELTTTPRATVTAYRDPLSNIVHHFDIPGRHGQLTIVAEAIVEFVGAPSLPPSLPVEAWAQVEAAGRSQSHWDFLQASPLTRETPLLKAFDATLSNGHRRDPLSEILAINEAIHRRFTYRQQVTGVDSPIDHALESGEGVCQDFAHVMLACVRRRGIPGRYVSGYLFHGSGDTSADGATHAWIEAFLPGLGWVGFDPTNNVVAGTRHIRVAIGRDYADVPPTKGVFRGRSANELAVAVQVSLADTAMLTRELMPVMSWTTPEAEGQPDWDIDLQQQQQQQ